LTPGAQTLEWVPRVAAAEREAFEAAASRDSAAAFRILEPTETGALMVAPPRPEYFPTLYVEPLLTAETELGLDHSVDPVRRVAMSRARDTGQATVTAPVLLPGDRQTRAVIAMVPVYTMGPDMTSAASVAAGRTRCAATRCRWCRSTTWRRTWRAKPPRCGWPRRSWT
jgi:CHASE1-domain containing sensor protein